MFDELILLPLGFWTSDFKFHDYLRERQNPAVDIMYADMIKERGALWLYVSILVVLPRFIPAAIALWFKTRNRHTEYPFLEFEPLMERSLLDIRQTYDLLPFIH